MPRSRIIVVTGPTASGKTALGIELAEALGGEIVSADSMQVYRHLDIGTAKPTPQERARVRHHLVDWVDPDETYHAGRFRDDAAAAIRQVEERGLVAVVVGGTALYLKTLLHGLAPGPGRDPRIRAELEARWEAGEHAALRRELEHVDPMLASRLHPNDRTRIVRGLEVWQTTGRALSSIQSEHGFAERPYEALRLGVGVERPELYARIDRRVVDMVDAGWVDEVKRVLALGYSATVPPLRAIGYKEIVGYVQGGGDLAVVVGEIQVQTRRFAKRQMTWFRRMALEWLDPQEFSRALTRARKFLQTP